MESDRSLNTALAALGNISADDLDEMLEFEPPMLTQTPDIMANNRQEISSQLNEFDSVTDTTNTSDLMSFDEMLKYPLESSSVLLLTQDEIETIEVDNSQTDPHVSRDRPNQSFQLSSNENGEDTNDLMFSQHSSEASENNRLETTFDKEFEQFDDMDFEIPSLDFDNLNTTSMENERESINHFQRRKMIQSCSGFCPKNDPPKVQNISASCPNVAKVRKVSTITSRKDTNDKNTSSFLETSYTDSSTSTINIESIMAVLESSQTTVHSDQNTTFDTNKDNHNTLNDKADESNKTAHPTRPEINSTMDATAIPPSLKQLYDLMKEQYSDFSFVYALSAQLCQDRIPMSCFVNVKMSLLLSIASIGKNPDIPPIPIIVMGNDPYMANYLITSLADLASRFVGPVDNAKPPSSDGYCNRTWIEADPIQLAKGGVFYAGEWTCLKAQRSEKIFKDIETSRVAVERTTRIYPLQTAVWAHWRALKYNSKDQQIFNKFVKIFGIPVYMDTSNYETLVDYVLKQASVQMFESTIDHLSIGDDDMRIFLAAISARTVDFTPEAIQLLQKYFVASRTERPDCLTKQAFTILKQYAESFAKLSLRHEVLVIDVIGAIFLCEHFIQHLYGSGIDPPPKLESVSFVGHVDTFVAQFNDWIKNYVAKYGDR